MDREVIDHRGPGFATLAREVLDGMRGIFQTSGPVVVFPASGTGGCEAALVNTLSAGDRVLIFETGAGA
jgi:alanine-glyoxylate transaminase / serine-glyoxylate transaminase / serine-pyruvate transaminase